PRPRSRRQGEASLSGRVGLRAESERATEAGCGRDGDTVLTVDPVRAAHLPWRGVPARGRVRRLRPAHLGLAAEPERAVRGSESEYHLRHVATRTEERNAAAAACDCALQPTQRSRTDTRIHENSKPGQTSDRAVALWLAPGRMRGPRSRTG